MINNVINNISRIAETQYFIRPVLVKALKQQQINPVLKNRFNNADTYYSFWESTFGDRFYDMGTIIRLGSEIENGLKYYYMYQKGHLTLLDLQGDANHSLNIFQRIQPWTNNNVIDLYKNQLGYDLTSNPHLASVQELTLYRHLYAHSSGLLTQKFIDDYKKLTNENLLELFDLADYPNQDVYFFNPLKRINSFIENTLKFFKEFP